MSPSAPNETRSVPPVRVSRTYTDRSSESGGTTDRLSLENTTKRPSRLASSTATNGSVFSAGVSSALTPVPEPRRQNTFEPGDGSSPRFEASDSKATKVAAPDAPTAGAALDPFPGAPPGAELTSRVVPAAGTPTNTSATPLVSPTTRLVAVDSKATVSPSGLSDGARLGPLACIPPAPTLTRVVVPPCRSRTNTSVTPLVSFGTRLLAAEANATKRPPKRTDGSVLGPFGSPPPAATLIRDVVPTPVSRR